MLQDSEESSLVLPLGSVPLAGDAASSVGLLERVHRTVGAHLVGDLDSLERLRGLLDGHEGSLELGGRGGLRGRCVAVLDLARLAGEDDEAGHVCLQAGNIKLEGLDAPIASAEIYGNTDRAGLFGGNADLLELLEGESLSELELGVVPLSGAPDSGAEKSSDRGGRDALRLGLACQTPALLAHGLVERDLYTLLPVLVKVLVGDHIVVLDHLGCLGCWTAEVEKKA